MRAWRNAERGGLRLSGISAIVRRRGKNEGLSDPHFKIIAVQPGLVAYVQTILVATPLEGFRPGRLLHVEVVYAGGAGCQPLAVLEN